MSNINDFSVAKVGDKVWVRKNDFEGWAEIEEIYRPSEYPIQLGRGSFNFKGEWVHNGPQCLFWSKPEIIAPERPKRLVKKVVLVRPYIDCLSNILSLMPYPYAFQPQNGYCGPEQTIEVLVEE